MWSIQPLGIALMSSRDPSGTGIAFIRRSMLWRTWILISLSGCLLPPPIDEGDPVDNHSPRIVPESLSPTPPGEDMSILCPPYSFRATVSETDREDTLYWRVFIDYERNLDADRVGGVHGELPPTNTGSTRLVFFEIDANNEHFRPTEVRGKFDVPHTVELLVADRPFIDSIEPIGKFVEDPGETDSNNWTIELLQTEDPDTCVGGGT
jgi:hypothetical protein